MVISIGISIWSLRELRRPDLKKQLEKLLPTASTEENGFGGSIMDPRVCTPIPSAREALESLIKEL